MGKMGELGKRARRGKRKGKEVKGGKEGEKREKREKRGKGGKDKNKGEENFKAKTSIKALLFLTATDTGRNIRENIFRVNFF